MRALRVAVVTLLLGLLAAPALAGDLDDARKAASEGRHADAAAAYAKALKAAPGARPALLGYLKAVAEGRVADHYDPATAAAGAALKAKPDDREVRLAFGDLFLARSESDERYRADAEFQFGQVLRADPKDEEAGVGLARMYYLGADYARGLARLDEVLAAHPQSALALFWKGTLLYDEAVQAFKGGPSMDERVRGLFAKALEAFEDCVKADPKRHAAWMKLGYAAQYLVPSDPSRRDRAAAAYEKALDLAPDDDAPLRGLSALYANDLPAYGALLDRLAKEKPKAPQVQFYRAYFLQATGKAEEAEKAYRAFVGSAKYTALGWHQLAELLRAKGDAEGAREAYRASLKADPTHRFFALATYWLVQPVNERARDAVRDADKARWLLKEYDAVIALSPRSITARNDAAFFLREAYDATGRKHRDLLDASIERYAAASGLVGEFREEYARSVPYKERHGFAQVLNDTGLMYQYYDAVRDLEKAESYYRRAMEWTEHGYWDAYGNLLKILEAAGRIEDALDFAEACAEGIKTENGDPQETFRATCRGDAERLRRMLPSDEAK